MIGEPPVPAPEAPPVPGGRLRLLVERWCERPIRAAWGGASAFAGHAWPGFALGAMAAMLAFCAYLGTTLRTGLGWVPDGVLGLAAAALALLAAGGIVVFLRAVAAAWPWRFCFGALGSLAAMTAILALLDVPLPFALAMAAVAILAAGALGGGISVLLRGRGAGWGHLGAAAALAAATLALGALLALRLAAPGSDPYLLPPPPVREAEPLKAPDPGAPGLWKTATLSYGSGTDRHRKEYGPAAALRTRPVDASLLLPDLKGLKARIRRRYWGFGKDAFPLNGRVTYPEGKGPFPLVLAVHGNHTAQAFSDGGYQYLGDLLASRGFIFVSVDENFLNGSWEGGIDKENAARAWVLLKHLEAWRAWNAEAGNPFQGKVDLDNVALVGHSRGGEAVALAAAFNRLPCDPENAALPFAFGFSIKAVAAIAPIDGQYEPSGQPIPMEDTSYFVLQGSHDSDVSMFAGYRPYKRAQFPSGGTGFKAALWVYRANHGQFNTAWGRHDAGPPLSWFLGTGALMAGEDQRRVAKVFLSGFLEATLHGHREYLPMFRDPAAAAPWLPRVLLINQFEDATFRAVSTFDGGLDLTRATLPGAVQKGTNLARWRERNVEGRGEWSFQDKAVTLGWVHTREKVPSYAIALPPLDWNLTASARLVFSLADTDEDPSDQPPPGVKKPIDLTVELVAADGTVARVPLSRIRPLQPVVKVRLTKWAALDKAAFKQAWEPVFQTFELPLALFREAEPAWNPRGLREIRFVFDRTERGVVLLDEVGFTF